MPAASAKSRSSALWIEAEFQFTELQEESGRQPAIPTFFAHMQLETADSVPRIRLRLRAEIDEDGEVTETMSYVIQVDDKGEPTRVAAMSRHDRAAIVVHYLPARRDPADHISHSANSLLSRALRAVDWSGERDAIVELTSGISGVLAENEAVVGIGAELASSWSTLHRGTHYSNPGLSFDRGELDNLLRHLTVGFSPGVGAQLVDFSRLSDGQQSLLYLAVVLSVQAIGRQVLEGTLTGFDANKLRPAVFTMVAMEEPENSLSPHYLGRVVKALGMFAEADDTQAIVATHAPSLLKRVPPENIRYLRLDSNRTTVVKSIILPEPGEEAYKFVREAVLAFPELYFTRLVILGEGDSEEVVLPRLLQATGLAQDDASIAVVPLGGRHVNHFWRLLNGLETGAHVTLLDLDLARYEGGWGRVRYVAKQLLALGITIKGLNDATIDALPKWNDADPVLTSANGVKWLTWLEKQSVFFSSPLDLDLALLFHSPAAYGVRAAELGAPDDSTLSAVLGKKRAGAEQHSADYRAHFAAYHRLFQLGSKPAAHLAAFSTLDDKALGSKMPPELARLIAAVRARIASVPE